MGVGAGFGGVGTGFAVGVGVGVAVAVGVGVGVGVAAMASGDGAEAGELATPALAAALSAGLAGAELTGLALGPLEVVVAGELSADVDPADDG